MNIESRLRRAERCVGIRPDDDELADIPEHWGWPPLTTRQLGELLDRVMADLKRAGPEPPLSAPEHKEWRARLNQHSRSGP